jgi:hypothetical protein
MAATTFDPANMGAACVLSNGNLTLTTAPSNYNTARSTSSKAITGKWIYELSFTAGGALTACGASIIDANTAQLNTLPGMDIHGCSYAAFGTTFRWNSVTFTGGLVDQLTTFMVAIDLPNLNMWVLAPTGTGMNWNGSLTDNPATNTGGLNKAAFFNGSLNTLLGGTVFAAASVYGGSVVTANFGATPFTHPIPTGFSSWDPPASGNSNFFFAA